MSSCFGSFVAMEAECSLSSISLPTGTQLRRSRPQRAPAHPRISDTRHRAVESALWSTCLVMWTWNSSLSLAFGTCNWAQAKRETFAECSTALNLAHSLRRGYKSWCRWSDRSVLVISSVAGMDTKRAIAHLPPLSSYNHAATSFSADTAYIVHCLMSWRERGSMPVARLPRSRQDIKQWTCLLYTSPSPRD